MSASSHVTTPKDIRQAATALEGVAVRTNLDRSERLSTEAGVDILLKREDQQKCRSFKVRGAYARMSLLSPAERERGVVCASAGNHAQGLAYACAHLGVRGTIYLPSNTPRQKRRRIATIGGQWVEQVIEQAGGRVHVTHEVIHVVEGFGGRRDQHVHAGVDNREVAVGHDHGHLDEGVT